MSTTLSIIILIVVLTLAAGSAFALAWTIEPNMQRGRAAHAAAAVGTDLYVFGGWATSSNPSWSAEKFDTITGVWSDVGSPMPSSLMYSAAVTVGNTIHLIGGGNSLDVLSFDTSSQTWGTSLAFPVGLSSAQAVYADDRIWVLGGTTSGPDSPIVLSTVYVSNNLAQSGGTITAWNLYPQSLPSPLTDHQAAVSNSIIYVSGGTTTYGNPGTPSAGIFSLDPSVGTWVVAGAPPGARGFHAGAAVGGRFFSFGGVNGAGTYLSNTVVFATLTGAVTTGSSMFAPLYDLQAVTIGDKIYVTGGYDDGIYEAGPYCWSYDPTADGFPVGYAVGGVVSGLVGEMTLQLNGGAGFVIDSNGPFTFPALVSAGVPYEVTIQQEPIGMNCTLSNGSGVMEYAPVSDVSIICTPAPPTISSIIDIPGDQGGQVRLRWDRNVYDSGSATNPVTSYGIFRRIDVGSKSSGGELIDSVLAYPPGDWDFLGSMPAFREDSYAMIVPTLADSSVAGGMHWSVYFVRASTADPGVFYDSPPDSGWSVDNLAPSVPTGLVLADGFLSWDDPADPDFNYFTVYGSNQPDLTAGVLLLGHTTGTDMDVAGAGYPYMLVTATDFAGNEGSAASIDTGLSDVPGSSPSRTALVGNYPNPFNPSTMIVFDLQKEMPVDLMIYDLSGRLVRILARGEVHPAGRNEANWDGRDAGGRLVAAGTYLFRLEAGQFAETKRMLLVK